MQGRDINNKILDIINSIPDGQFVFVEDIKEGISHWTKDAVEYFGFSEEDLRNTKEVIQALVHPDDLARWEQELAAVFSLERDGFFLTYQIKNAKGDYAPCTGKGKIILDDEGEPVAFVGSITIRKDEEAHDAITDLPKFQTFLKHVSRTKKENRECLLMALEIKRFNSINALYGYNFGTRILYEIAGIIKKTIETNGSVYRIDGVTFGIIINNNSLDYAKTVFKKIRDKLAKLMLDGSSVNVEVYGGALYTKNYEVSSQTVYSCLLSALEKAKDKDSYEMVIFDDESHETNYKMLELLDTIKAGIRNECEGFYLCYQPLSILNTFLFAG